MSKKKAVIVYSGGLDSRTVLAKAMWMDRDVFPLSMFYGQRHQKELDVAKKVCKELGIHHKVLNLDFMLDIASHSSLTNPLQEVPKGHYEDKSMRDTVVPNRNMIFLSLAIAYAVNIGADEVWFGVHSGDHAIYPDCRPSFVHAMQEVAELANYETIKLVAPYLEYDKAAILKEGFTMLVDYTDTWTCYEGRDKACGKCGSCRERLEAFDKIGLPDPIEYEV